MGNQQDPNSPSYVSSEIKKIIEKVCKNRRTTQKDSMANWCLRIGDFTNLLLVGCDVPLSDLAQETEIDLKILEKQINGEAGLTSNQLLKVARRFGINNLREFIEQALMCFPMKTIRL